MVRYFTGTSSRHARNDSRLKTMPKWMMKFELEGHLGVEDGLPLLRFNHPDGAYSVDLENVNMEPGTEIPLLSAYITFSESDLQAAATAGKKYCSRFIDVLAFATGSRFRMRKQLCLWNWEPTVSDMREGVVYNTAPDPNVPQKIMNERLAGGIDVLLRASEPDLLQATHWFALGVTASGPDDQFEAFWFAIETLARHMKDPGRVPDRCSRCREPLWCKKCEDTSMHRPYPSQAISQLFARYVRGDADVLHRMTSEMRHALLHGDDIAAVEQK